MSNDAETVDRIGIPAGCWQNALSAVQHRITGLSAP
jgi:hypothetical protein